MAIELQVAKACEHEKIPPVGWFNDWFEIILDQVGDPRRNLEVSVRICDSEESCALNRNYRGIDKPTNVLSFPANIDLKDFSHVLGDLAICWDVLSTESRDQNKDLVDHASHLFIHGILHLLGYTHDDARLASFMEKIEIETLARQNVADPYRGL